MKISKTLLVIEKLRGNSQLNKHIHFNASKRNRRYHIWVGVPIVVITVLISFFFALTGVERSRQTLDSSLSPVHASIESSVVPPSPLRTNIYMDAPSVIYFPVWMEWVGALLALFAAALSGIQTFFNFQKEYEGNRQIGNQYLSIARECERLIALYVDDLLQLPVLAEEVERLNRKYSDINSQAESFNVTDKDYVRAKIFQEEKERTEQSIVQRIIKKEKSESELGVNA